MGKLWASALVLGFSLGLVAADATAHRMNAALSIIEINGRTGELELIHRLYAHDLEHAIDLGAAGIRYFETEAGKRALKSYTEANFTLKDARGRPVALRFIGTELSGDLVYIYFAGRAPAGKHVLVDSDLLQAYSERQINQVNVRASGQTRSAVFVDGAVAKRIAIPGRR
jgi:hypothetical protein